jgi:hyaluronoglucosaminidase
VSSPFAHRGIVEGFYGTPWSHDDRLWWIDRLGDWGMNRYVHAPKEDPYHRDRWREPYPAQEQREFGELIERGHKRGVEVGFAFSPGLSIEYSSATDRSTLREKLGRFAEQGARFFALALDDVPSVLTHESDRRAFRTLAEAHVALAHEVYEAMGDDATLWVIPTDYLGTEATDYLEGLGEALPPAVEIGWTGRTVLTPEIRAEEALARATLLRRRVLLWDNTPAADGPMRPMLHLTPYQGREPGLAEYISGVLLNPMTQARASSLTVRTAARYLEAPEHYDPERAFVEAARELGAHAPDAFLLFARAHRFSPLAPDDRDVELEGQLEALRAEVEAQRPLGPAVTELRQALEARSDANARVRSGIDPKLGVEIAPWLESHASETRRMRAAVECIAGIDAAPQAKDGVFAFMALESKLSREPIPSVASYGPRRVLYPQLVSMRDDEMALTRDPTLVTDRCLADDFVTLAERFALARVTRR